MLGVICTAALFDQSDWDRDSIVGLMSLSAAGLVLGGVSISNQVAGRGLAIAGFVLSALGLLAGIGLLVN